MTKDALSLLEAKVWLWPEWVDGTANTGLPVWDGIFVQSLRADRQQISIETRPTGAKFPRRRNLLQGHEISIGKIVVTLGDAVPAPIPLERLVLQIGWVPETWAGQPRNRWLRRIYRGVVLASDSEGDRDGIQLTGDIRFMAEAVEESNGSGPIPKGP